ncbi:nucleotidyltransferase substrate binding protein [Shouchella shacheensis]|uniref:nucleotidyltransferase substrate binding protein n=1 Tax=Shouchella shacheensis TaxID=1649580 RepID=UPI000AA65161|nr:nucleotidyltransferase substrate binding protein [Shouchella shacheensis]
MERVKQRLQTAQKALSAFEEVLEIQSPSAIERDASLQRFEVSFEACWKAGKQFLYDVEGLDVGSPKGVFRTFREIGYLSEEHTISCLTMINDRTSLFIRIMRS